MTISRRGFVSGLIAAVAAPVVVRRESLMQIRDVVMPAPPTVQILARSVRDGYSDFFTIVVPQSMFRDLIGDGHRGFSGPIRPDGMVIDVYPLLPIPSPP